MGLSHPGDRHLPAMLRPMLVKPRRRPTAVPGGPTIQHFVPPPPGRLAFTRIGKQPSSLPRAEPEHSTSHGASRRPHRRHTSASKETHRLETPAGAPSRPHTDLRVLVGRRRRLPDCRAGLPGDALFSDLRITHYERVQWTMVAGGWCRLTPGWSLPSLAGEGR
jgi:hypothetical protein